MNRDSSSGRSFDERRVLTNAREDVERLQQSVLGAVERLNYDPSSAFAIRLALEEALSNAFKHGNRLDPDKTVTVDIRVGPEAVCIMVEDEGEGFDPATVPDPVQEENIEIPCGRGIVLMQAFMTEVCFQPPGNRVEMTYVRPS
jgi:serine/threonine-protein kinase RsbW